MEYKLALLKAQRLCSKQEKCKFDIRRKLEQWNISAENVEKIIDHLVKEKFIDEQRYAEAFVRDKLKFNKWGRIKISYHLKQRNIAEDTITEALKAIDNEEYGKILEKLLRDKLGNLKFKNDQRNFEKLISFAYNKGFSYEESSSIVKQLLQ